jgi:2-oxoglutarate ferredoxin oxidoreductase subunit alpha
MSIVDDKAISGQTRTRIVNDFSIVAATVNGSGSQTANSVIARSLFKMGIPVSGKNLFPSNIKGLPTWFWIRANKDGYTARQEHAAVLIAMNLATAAEDIENVVPGGIVIHPDDWRIEFGRDDLVYYPIPVKSIVKESDTPSKLRDYVANMVYVGAVAELLGIPLEYIKDAISYYLGGKEKAIKLNLDVVEAAEVYVRENLQKQDPFYVEPMDKTDGMIMIDGNSASALGAVFGGVNVISWYPITPSTSLVDSARDYLAHLRRDPETGKATYAIVQAEDELSAIGMVLGAGWAGARSMTATSGPGISLMAEYAGLGYAAELPGVIWNVQRVGPSTGLPTRTSQGDLTFTYFLGHGDSRHVVLMPGNMEECFEFGWKAFNLADELQTPIFVLTDLELGMNQWMSQPFDYPDQPIKRGKTLDANDLAGMETFARFKDVDNDGIGYRTLPGTDHPLAAYFSRGTGHDEYALYSERPEHYVQNTERLKRKHDTARKLVPAPLIDKVDGADVGVVVFGSTEPAVVEARDILRDEHDLNVSYMRVRALPLTQDVFDFVKQHKRVYVIENNVEGQLHQIMKLDTPDCATNLISIAHLDGLSFTAPFVVDRVLEQEQNHG